MIGFIALDFILRLIRAGMVNVTFVGNVTPMHLDNFSTNPASFRIPTYMIANLEGLTHGSIQLRTSVPHLRHIAERTASQAAYEGSVPFVRSDRNVRFSNRPFGVKRFQTIHDCGVDVAHGLVLLFGIGARALPS